MPVYSLFIDLDGVLADFDAGVTRVCGQPPSALAPKQMWPQLARTPDFYATLPWMPDGTELWQAVRPLDPTILTGLPLGKWAEPQKRAWCTRELGPSVPVVTCMSRDKHIQAETAVRSGRIPILVDDRERLAAAWEAAGGTFIHHQTAKQSLLELRRAFPELFRQ